MTHKTDDTLRDDSRREIALNTGLEVEKYLPDYFKRLLKSKRLRFSN